MFSSAYNRATLLRRFVLGDLPIDLLPVMIVVGPGVAEIFRAKRRISTQNLGFAAAETERLHEHPHRDPRPRKARLAAACAGRVVNSRGGVTNHSRDPLQRLRPFARRELGNELSYRLER